MMNAGSFRLTQTPPLFFGSVATSLSKSADVDNSEPESSFGDVPEETGSGADALHMKYSCCDN